MLLDPSDENSETIDPIATQVISLDNNSFINDELTISITLENSCQYSSFFDDIMSRDLYIYTCLELQGCAALLRDILLKLCLKINYSTLQIYTTMVCTRPLIALCGNP